MLDGITDWYDDQAFGVQMVIVTVVGLLAIILFVVAFAWVGNTFDLWPNGDCYQGCTLTGYQHGSPVYDCKIPCGGN